MMGPTGYKAPFAKSAMRGSATNKQLLHDLQTRDESGKPMIIADFPDVATS
jgi:hypothetical protein